MKSRIIKSLKSDKTRIALIICTAIFLVSLCAWFSYSITFNKNSNYIYPVINTTPTVPIENKDTIELQNAESGINFNDMLKINSQTIGWISAPELGISEPIVQSGDNEKYLNYDFYGNRTGEGAVFLDYACEDRFESKHVIIYGHNMLDGGMFSPLGELKNEQSFKKYANDITLITQDNEIKLKIIAVTAASADNDRRTCEFRSNWVFDKFVRDAINGCELKNVPEEKIERLYTFITCSYEGADYRTYVYAVER